MNHILKIRKEQFDQLEEFCKNNNIDIKSIKSLLDAEKTKKLLKRNALIQSNIEKEINKAIEDENRKNYN